MTKISTYNIDDNVTANDKWIGSDVNNFNKTKNFTPKKLAIYFNGSQVINTGMELLYKYFTITPPETRPVGTISFENEIGPVVSFSSITTFLISKYTQKGNEVNEFLGFLVGTKSLLYKADDINVFGYYDIVSIDPYIDDNNFYVVTLSFIEGNGAIEEDKDYMISMVDANTAEAQDLQSVTDLGASTTNPITINASFSEENALYIYGGDTGINVTGDNYGVYSRTFDDNGINFIGNTLTGTIAKYYLGSAGHGIVIYNEETSTGDIFSLVRGSGTIFNIDTYGAIDSNSYIISNLILPSEHSPINGINDNLPDIVYTLKPSGIYGSGYYGGRFISSFTGGSAILAEAETHTGITILVNSSASINAIDVIDEELYSVMNVGKDGDITAHSFIKKDGTGTNLLLDDGSTIPLNDVGNQSIQDVTDVGATTTNTIIIDSANYYSSLGPDAVGTENKDTGTYTYIGADGVLGIKNDTVESQLKNTDVTNNGVILEFPNKASGSYTLATTSDLGTNLSPSQTSTSFTINSDNGTDATIPLGDGSYAGATLNNYTTAEKNKLEGIATGANVGVVPNSPITGATKTKITYDSKGLVTSGANATTDDIGEGVTNLYWSNSKTIGSVLNGISISGTSIISTDTILQALGKAQNQINSLTGGVTYQGIWNALTNDPTLTSSVGTKGFYYIVSVAGSTNLNGITDWKLGDWAIYDGTAWQKVDNTDSVISVNGYTGIVSLTTADVPDSINKRYVTNANLAVINNTSGTNTGDQNLQTVTNGVGNNTTTNTITAASLIKDGGQSSQFLKADGSVDNNTYLTAANLPSTLTLYATNVSAGINGYSKLVTTIDNPDYPNPSVPVSTGAITTTGQFIAGLVSDANLINGNPGIFNVTTIGEISRTNGTGTAEFYFTIHKRTSAGVETLIGTSGVTLPVTNGGYSEFQATAIWNDGVFVNTDRIVIKYYANRISGGSNPTYSFLFGGSASPVRTIVPIPTAVIPNIYLADLADVENVTPLNNEILYYNTSASLWEHSLVNDLMPTATSSVTGKLLNTDWANFNTAYTNRITSTGGAPLSISSNIISIAQANDTTNGYLTFNDWNVFNSKQNALSGTGFIKISGTALSYDDTNYTPTTRSLTINGTAYDLSADRAWTIPTYSLPVSTSSILGGVKIGSGVNVTVDGTISVSTNYQAPLSSTGIVKSTAGTISYLTDNTANWDTAYSERFKWDGSTLANSGTSATGRTSLGATTVGSNIFTSANPTAIKFLRANLDNTVDWLDASQFRTAIGAGTGGGSVTSVAALNLTSTSTADLTSSVTNGTAAAVITLNVPDAGTESRGVVTTGAQTFKGVKTFDNNGVKYPATGNGLIATINGGGTLTTLSETTYPSLQELAYVKYVTNPIQTQLNYDAGPTQRGAVTTGIQTFAGAKTFSDIATFGTIKSTIFGTSELVATAADGSLISLNTDDGYPSLDEIKYVAGVTSSIQTQLNYDAGASQRGAITTGVQTIAGNKTFSGETTTLNNTVVSAGYWLTFPSGGGPIYTSRVTTNSLSGNRTIGFPDASGTIALTSDISGYAPLLSPTFTGTPSLTTTPTVGDNTTKLASTAFVKAAIDAQVYNITMGTGGVSFTTADTTTAPTGSYSQNGRNVMIDNGAVSITITCSVSATAYFIASYTKLGLGTTTITFQPSGGNLTILGSTAVLSGNPGSTALLTRNGAGGMYYLQVNNL